MTEVHPLLAVDVTDDPELARAVWANLKRIADAHEDPVWREMAREVVEGRLTTGQLLSYGAYQEAMAGRADDLAHGWDALSETERERLIAADEEHRVPVEVLVGEAEAAVVDQLIAEGLSRPEAVELANELRLNARG